MHSMLFFIVLLCSFSMQAMPEESVARVAGSRRVKAKVNQSIENRAVTHVQTPQQEHARLSALLQKQIRKAKEQGQFASPIQINSASIVAPAPQYSLMTQKQLMEEHARLSALQEQQRKQLEMAAAQPEKNAAAQALLSLCQEPDNSSFSRSLVSVQPAVVRKSVQFDKKAAVPSILRSKKRKKP